MIHLKDLKQQIETNSLDKHLIIYKCSKGSEFIPHQYAHEFCHKNNCDVNHVEEISQLPHRSLFESLNISNLTMLHLDSLSEELNVDQEEVATNYIWVVCRKINKKYMDLYDTHIVEVPKIELWQVKDFITSRCKNLSNNQVNELLNYYKNDLFRLDNELSKIELLGDDKYSYLRNQLYVDISEFNIFDIVDSIVKRNRIKMSNIYEYINYIDVDVFGLVQLLINNFRYVIDIQLAKNATAESVGVSSKQFWAIKNYSCGFYSKQELIYIFELLNEIDSRIKSGKLDVNIVIDYIICKILSL